MSTKQAHTHSTTGAVALALFKDSETDARQVASWICPVANFTTSLSLTYVLSSTGSTSAQTWKLRYGSNTGTTYFLRRSGGDLYLTANEAVIDILEVLT